jgi:di/tricarboxylate transporter
VLDILPAAFLAAFALVALRVLTPGEARDAVDLNVVVLIAASFGLGAAMSESGLAKQVATLFVQPLGGLGGVGLLVGVLVATTLLTELITNNAAAVLMFPIAVAAALQADFDARPFAIAVAIGASASFLTPVGYQTNTMVYGIGGYRFGDFARVGLPLTLLMIVVVAVFVPLAWPLRP